MRLDAKRELREARQRYTLARDTDRAAAKGDIATALEMLRLIITEGSETVSVTDLTESGVDVKLARRIVAAKRRQALQAAGDVLYHQREMAKLAASEKAASHAAPVAPEIHLHLHPPANAQAERDLMDGLAKAQLEAAAMRKPRPDLVEGNGHEGNGNA